MLKAAIVNGVKNENGVFVAPDVTKFNKDNLLFLGTDANDVDITGRESGDTVVNGEYYVGKFNEETNHFVSTLVAVPGFTVNGEAKVDNVTAQGTNDCASVKINSNQGE